MLHTHAGPVFVVVSLFALALTVALRRALGLLYHVPAADAAAEALPNVVPDLCEGAGRALLADAGTSRGAALMQEFPRGAGITDHRLPAHRVQVFEGLVRAWDRQHCQGKQQGQQQGLQCGVDLNLRTDQRLETDQHVPLYTAR